MAYCPSCGGEFVDRVTACPDCEVPLTAEPPPGDGCDDDPSRPTVQWETVLETGDPALLAGVKSVLQGAGVPFVVIGEALQNLEGVGVLGAGYNPIFGAARVRVPADRAGEARELLSEEAELSADPDALTEPAAAGSGEPGDPVSGGSPAGRWESTFQGAGMGLLIGILAGLAIAASGKLDHGEEEEPASGVSAFDSDGDGRPDGWSRYEDGVARSISYDRNFDGEPDTWIDFDRQSRRTSWRSDHDYDGEPDSFTRYEDGRAVSIEEDTDFDGEIDRWVDLDEHELPEAERQDVDGDGRPDVWLEFGDGGLVIAERVDTDLDGSPDDHYELDENGLVAGRRDTDYDGTYDVVIAYRFDQREEMTWEARPGAPARKLTYRHGTLREELRDRDGDGDWDLRIVYDPYEYPAEEIELP